MKVNWSEPDLAHLPVNGWNWECAPDGRIFGRPSTSKRYTHLWDMERGELVEETGWTGAVEEYGPVEAIVLAEAGVCAADGIPAEEVPPHAELSPEDVRNIRRAAEERHECPHDPYIRLLRRTMLDILGLVDQW